MKENRRISDELESLIDQDPEQWSRVAYRELALEKVRQAEFPQYPSRMACLYTSRTLQDARGWAEFFRRAGRQVFSIVRLGVEGRIFSGDACLCFDGVENEEENLPLARSYWRRDRRDGPVVLEVLADGRMEVLEIVETY